MNSTLKPLCAALLLSSVAVSAQVAAQTAAGGNGQSGQYAPANAGAYVTSVPGPVPMANSGPRGAPLPQPSGPPDLVQDMLDKSAPLSPEEIRKFLSEMYKRNQAINENVSKRAPAKPVTSLDTLDLSPGSPPPIVRVAMGQGATLSFADAAGRPWPIADNLNFNDNSFSVKLIAPHLYSISLKKMQAANITIVLQDLARPITVTVVPATDETDYLKEFIVPKFLGGVAPATVSASLTSGALAHNAPELLDYLYRTPPKGAKPLAVSGLPGVMAWQTTPQRIVIRTSGMVVIPAWLRRHSATDGVAVYELPLTPVVTITQDGLQHRVRLDGFALPSMNSGANLPVQPQ